MNGMRSMLARSMLAVLMMTTVETSIAEFIEIQRLTSSELRERFELPEACEPTVGAMRSRFQHVTVLISCDDTDGADASS